jgi:hypothetical protein
VRHTLIWLLCGLLLACVGCGGAKDKEINKDKDKPKPAAKT